MGHPAINLSPFTEALKACSTRPFVLAFGQKYTMGRSTLLAGFAF